MVLPLLERGGRVSLAEHAQSPVHVRDNVTRSELNLVEINL